MASVSGLDDFFQSLSKINAIRKKRKAKNPPSLTPKTPPSSQVKSGKNGFEPKYGPQTVGHVKPYEEAKHGDS